MAGSGVVSSWASSIVGDLPPPKKIQQPSQEEQQHQNADNQVNILKTAFLVSSPGTEHGDKTT